MADKETIRLFKRFSDSNIRQEEIDFAKVLSAKLNWSRSQRQMFNGLLSNLSRLGIETKEYINTKKDMVTMVQKNLESTINNESVVKKYSLGRKIAGIAGAAVALAGFYGATPAYGQDSGVTNTCPTPGVDYQKIADQAFDFNKNNQYQDALAILQPCLKDPCNKNVKIYIEAGFALESMEQFEEAEKYLLIGAKLDPKEQSVYNNLGYVYYKTARKEEAKKQFKISYDIDPTTSSGKRAKRWLDSLK